MSVTEERCASGFSLAKETISQLIGEAPSVELIKSVLSDIEKHKEILGIHNYTFLYLTKLTLSILHLVLLQ